MVDLGQDHWKYNTKAQCIDGEHSGCCIRLGQAIKVRIVSVNVPARQLNVCPIEPLATAPKSQNKSKIRKKKRKTAKKAKKRRSKTRR